MAGRGGASVEAEAEAATLALIEAASCAICGALFDCPLLLRSCGHSCEQCMSCGCICIPAVFPD